MKNCSVNVNNLNDKLLNVNEVAKYLGVKPGWVYKAVAQGILRYKKYGKYLRFELQEVKECGEQNKEGR